MKGSIEEAEGETDLLAPNTALFRALAVCADPEEAETVTGQLARLLGLDYFS